MTVSRRPEPGPVMDYSFPEFFQSQLNNGMQLMVAPMHRVPLVTVLAVTDAGAMNDPVGKYGIAQLTAGLLNEGSGALDGEELTDYLERLGTSVGAFADWDSAMMSMTVLPDKLERAFRKFAEVLTLPTFPEKSLERMRGERLTQILHIESEPRELANEMFEKFIYTEGSRYGVPVGGTKESVASITRDDVLAFYRKKYRPQTTSLIITGDISVEEATQLAQEHLSRWEEVAIDSITVDDRPAHSERGVHIVNRPDAPQSELRIGHVGVPRDHPHYFDITVMNGILGGLFGSRINLNLREKHGYTYGARSTYDWRRGAGPFSISTAVASNVTADAIRQTLNEVERMRTELVSDAELELAINYLSGIFPIRFETTASVASALATLVIYNLPADWYDSYRENIAAVTAESVLGAAQTHVQSDKMQIVIVGNSEEIKDSVVAEEFGQLFTH